MRHNSGQGTTFRLKLPLTLAIIKALLFRVEHILYAVPLNSVAEITRAKESDLHQVNHYEVLQLRNQALSVIRLGRPLAEPSKYFAKVFVLVMSAGDGKLGLIVDALEGEEELAIQALDDDTVATDLVSGASILGDGRVVLILNLVAIVERSLAAPAEIPGKWHLERCCRNWTRRSSRCTQLEDSHERSSARPGSRRSRFNVETHSSDIGQRQHDSGGRHCHGWNLRTQED